MVSTDYCCAMDPTPEIEAVSMRVIGAEGSIPFFRLHRMERLKRLVGHERQMSRQTPHDGDVCRQRRAGDSAGGMPIRFS